MSTQIFAAFTAYGLATLGAALADGHFAAAERRILLVSNNTTVPEATPGPTDMDGIGDLLDQFDAVYSLNETYAPLHPVMWRPRQPELPIWQRLLCERWGIDPGDELRLVLQTVYVEPARALAYLFPDAVIDVYADGLMSYGPTRTALVPAIGARLDRLLYPDLVPGLRPVLHSEWGIRPTRISADAMRKVLARIDRSPSWLSQAEAGSVAVVLGQYLSDLGLMSSTEERDLELGMLQAAAVRPGVRRLVFKAHPAASVRASELAALAAGHGLDVTVHADPQLAETWFGHPAVGFVGGCFSTGLATAARLYNLPVRSTGTELVLGRLTPVANSNRVPLLLADQLYGDGQYADQDQSPGVDRLAVLVKAVTYAMQPTAYRRFQSAASEVATADPALLPRYVPRSRLAALGLIGPAGLRRASRVVPRRLRRRLVEASFGRPD